MIKLKAKPGFLINLAAAIELAIAAETLVDARIDIESIDENIIEIDTMSYLNVRRHLDKKLFEIVDESDLDKYYEALSYEQQELRELELRELNNT